MMRPIMAACIRLATLDDAEAVAALYAPYVRETAISFETEAPGVEEMRRRIRGVLEAYPWLVCEGGGEVAGYAYASKHAERAAYRWSVDVTVYVDPRAHRLGAGRGLYTSLLELLRLQGYYMAYAGITLPNDGSIGLHTAMGFRPVALYENVGFKDGTWHAVAYLGLELQPCPSAPEEPRAPGEMAFDERWVGALRAGETLVRL